MSKKDASNRLRAETITPLRVPVDIRGRDNDRPKSRYKFGITLLICSVVILVGLGAWFLLYLSKNPFLPQPLAPKQAVIQPVPAPTTAAAKPEAPPAPAADPQKTARDQLTAETKLAEFLALKNELDGKGAAKWEEASYAEMIEAGRQADALFMDKSYESASTGYIRAIDIGRRLAGQADQVLQRMLAEGRAALAAGSGTVAGRKFKVALMIDPANREAQKGQRRSQTIETVFALIESGQRYENNNALSQALAEYQKAIQLDPEATTAHQAHQRVAILIKNQKYRQLLSAGLTAFHNNDYELARSRLKKAKSLKPDSREVSEALLQVDQAIRLDRIDRLRLAAQKAEQSEDWQAALKSYRELLDIDRNLKFAAEGRQRADEQFRITKRLDYYISQPQVLESDKQLKNAVLLLEAAKEVRPRTRGLSSRIAELEKMVIIARTPVTVIVESDSHTQIAVYKVGKLGRFAQRELKLRPGTYTVVGTRDGYKDVRQQVVVAPGRQALRVTVKCQEKI